MKFSRGSFSLCLLLLPVLLVMVAAPSSAIYHFEGIPLKTVAEGQINGDLMTFSTLGLDVPPRECRFELPDDVVWARAYAGVWGGTEKYSGWVRVTANGQSGDTITLYGDDDKNPSVYESGHGVYWVAADVTPSLKKGSNVVSVATSRGEPGNKLDGRIYGVVVLALVKNSGGVVTRYWIAEGNENLHGEGWAGTNPTTHLTSNITFSGASPQGATAANLTVLLLATNSGQPDYITFNQHDLGRAITGSPDYPDNSRDIGNERSFDAAGGIGIDTRYTDMDVFDVKPYLLESNTVGFEIGRDLNKDGTISSTGQKPEAEDYIHPCLAILTITSTGTAAAAPDLLIEKITTTNAYEGMNATITAMVRNQGAVPATVPGIIFRIDGATLHAGTVEMDAGGSRQVSAAWQATGGTHTIEAEVQADGDTNPVNNIRLEKITVSSPPRLQVSAGTPRRAAPAATPVQKSPLAPILPLAGVGALLIVSRIWRRNLSYLLPLLLLTGCIALSPALVSPAAAAEGAVSYLLPVQITNSGGSDVAAFGITLYLDGEKTATTIVDRGLAAGASRQVELPVFTTPGKHSVKIVADEAGGIARQDTTSHVIEQALYFP